MGELSYSAGAHVAGTTILECGPAVFSKAEDAPCPANLFLSCLCHNNLRPGCSQMLIYCRKDEYVVVSPHSGIPHTVQMRHLP